MYTNFRKPFGIIGEFHIRLLILPTENFICEIQNFHKTILNTLMVAAKETIQIQIMEWKWWRKEGEKNSRTQNSNRKNHKEIFQKPRVVQARCPAQNFIQSGVEPYACKTKGYEKFGWLDTARYL